MTRCGSLHPDVDVRCEAPEGNHEEHYARPEYLWPNLDWRPPPPRRSRSEAQEEITALAQEVRGNLRADRSPVVRGNDPWAAYAGAARIEPQRDHLNAIALAMFRERPRRNRAEFMDPSGPLGKLDGDRRARDLRLSDYGNFYIKTVPTITGPQPSDYVLIHCPECGYEMFYMEEEKLPEGGKIEWSRCVPCEVTYTSVAGTMTLTPI